MKFVVDEDATCLKFKAITQKECVNMFFQDERTQDYISKLCNSKPVFPIHDVDRLFESLVGEAIKFTNTKGFLNHICALDTNLRDAVKQSRQDFKYWQDKNEFEPIIVTPEDKLHPDTFFEQEASRLKPKMRLMLRLLINRILV